MMSDNQKKSFQYPDLFWNTNRFDFVTVAIAIILTLLVHALIFCAVPYNPKREKSAKKDELQIQIEPPKIDRRIPELVEANPLANQLEPKNDSPESFQNQRVADEITDPKSKSKMPYVEGEIKDGRKIVQGTNAPQNAAAAAQEVVDILERPLQKPVPIAEQSPTNQNEKKQSEKKSESEKDAKKTEEQKKSESEKPSQAKDEKKSDGKDNSVKTKKGEEQDEEKKSATQKNTESENVLDSKDSVFESAKKFEKPHAAPDDSSVKSKGKDKEKASKKSDSAKKSETQNEIAKESAQQKPEDNPQEQQVPKPRMRPSLSMKTPAGPLADNRTRASNQGTLAVDSRFSEFGAYQQRMIEAVSRQWNLLGSQYDLSSAVGTQVVIEFSLNTKGELTRIEVLFTNSSNLGKGLCEQSILTTAPYGEWTEEMVAALGAQDCPVRINFFYR